MHQHHDVNGSAPDVWIEADGLEQHTLTSVGIDIGSSTSQVMVSRLTLRRRGSELSTEFVVTERKTLYASTPLLTPYSTGTLIDIDGVAAYVESSYALAGVEPDQVDTGVVVITGEALKKENAAAIADLMAGWAGDFVCVSAGANHEAVLAAHGSGSVAMSKRDACRILNIDVGGGTTKVSLIDDGQIQHSRAFSVGARLITWADDGRVTRIEEPVHAYTRHLGISPPELGTAFDGGADQLGELMARVVLDVVEPGPLTALRRELMVTEWSDEPAEAPSIDRIVFSGGVAEYIEGRETESFGDLGPSIGAHLRRLLAESRFADLVVAADNGIRATVIGASQFSVQASGQTCYISDQGLLPIRGIPVARLDLSADSDPRDALAAALRRHDRGWDEPFALSVHLQGAKDYRTLRGYADALVSMASGHPIVVVLRDDLARSLGRLMVTESGHRGPAVIIDGITVAELDYLDIGTPMGETGSIPVTVKSLAFPQ